MADIYELSARVKKIPATPLRKTYEELRKIFESFPGLCQKN